MPIRCRPQLWRTLALILPVALPASADDGTVNVRDFGATGDGRTRDTAAVQEAIDACAAKGGGTVVLPAGTYLCGTVELKSHTRLFLGAGAVLAGGPEEGDYRKLLPGNNYHVGNPLQPHNRDQALIVARKATDVGVVGPGAVDARGHHFYDRAKIDARGRFAVGPWRPGPTLLFIDCDDVRLSEFQIRDNPFFAVNLVGCNGVAVDGLRIANDFRFQNGDGIHVASSRGVRIADCRIETEDDALCFYTHHDGLTEGPADCTGVTVANCVLASGCSGIRIGYTGAGRLGDMAFANLVITRAFNGIDFLCTAKNTYKGEANATGPSVGDILFANVVIRDAQFGVTANVFADAKPPGGIRDLLFTGLKVRSARGNYLVGGAADPIGGITFRDADFTVTGALPTPAPAVPDPLSLFGTRTFLPHAFLVRHAEDVAFRDCRIRWDGATGDWRSALHVVDGRGIDCRSLRAEPIRPDDEAAITSLGATVRLPDRGR